MSPLGKQTGRTFLAKEWRAGLKMSSVSFIVDRTQKRCFSDSSGTEEALNLLKGEQKHSGHWCVQW